MTKINKPSRPIRNGTPQERAEYTWNNAARAATDQGTGWMNNKYPQTMTPRHPQPHRRTPVKSFLTGMWVTLSGDLKPLHRTVADAETSTQRAWARVGRAITTQMQAYDSQHSSIGNHTKGHSPTPRHLNATGR